MLDVSCSALASCPSALSIELFLWSGLGLAPAYTAASIEAQVIDPFALLRGGGPICPYMYASAMQNHTFSV